MSSISSPSNKASHRTHNPPLQNYSASKVSAAVSQGCNYFQSNQQVGSNDYPHRYNNYEGFDFRVAGPYQEFPIKTSGVYTGGKFSFVENYRVWMRTRS